MADNAEVVLTRTDGRVRVITLNRPRVRNALNSEMMRRFHQAVDDAVADPEVGAIVVTGNGSAFSSGADLKEAGTGRPPEDLWGRYSQAIDNDRIYERLSRVPKPVIAAVNGFAVGGGCAIAVSCDVVIAADTARFSYPETNHGIAAVTVAVGLSRAVGRLQALDLLLSGRFVEAAEAHAMGMVTRVVPADDLMAEAVGYAQALAEKSPTAIRLTKRVFRAVQELDFDRAFEYARDVSLMTREGWSAGRAAAASPAAAENGAVAARATE
ncbi:putative enoyl-CoA hydratase echA8 [Sphaerisporangium krabiense]|uniref:Enoyl-CoA hydratase n=1 Tax=Sphaerisporangium krabiense TaxID=763782 RepID=A0A7W9DPY1_9ACTN|nr:enoyl-CoA hydratase/isomerase family protein [Sphaerisporangium krabiense]MBB5625825.1 enoyl-CoA hydratase [Sphaerisporangium krabiense]GII62837.1 putative enoyl-CoA hydratase echA8 [Sphaerisporangium krabiense]